MKISKQGVYFAGLVVLPQVILQVLAELKEHYTSQRESRIWKCIE